MNVFEGITKLDRAKLGGWILARISPGESGVAKLGAAFAKNRRTSAGRDISAHSLLGAALRPPKGLFWSIVLNQFFAGHPLRASLYHSDYIRAHPCSVLLVVR